MKVRIRLFAQQRQLTGWRERTIDLPEGSRVSSAWDALVSEWPILAPGTDSVRFARNAVYADADELLSDGDEVAVIPPVAGGAARPGEVARPVWSGAAERSGSATGIGATLPRPRPLGQTCLIPDPPKCRLGSGFEGRNGRLPA